MSAWPETWSNLQRMHPAERERRMVVIARGVGGPSLDHQVFRALNLLLAEDPFPHAGVALSSAPVRYHELFAGGADSDSVLRHRHHHNDYSTDDLYHEEVRFWTRRERQQVARAWADRNLLLSGRAVGFIGRLRNLAAQVAGDRPVHDAQGLVLTGQAAFARRQEIYAGELCTQWRLAGDHTAMMEWLRTATGYDLAAGALSPDLPVAKQQLCERIDDAARDHLAYLLDCEDPAYARPVGTEQSTAVALLERWRQAGRRSVRVAATAALALTASTNTINLVEGVVVEHAPVWRSSTGAALTLIGGVSMWTNPGIGAYSLSLRVARTGERAAATDAITLEAQDLPAGWSAVLGAKLSDAAAWPVNITAPAGVPSRDYDFALVARDAIGPSRLRVRVRVPAATG